jgi:hypothetical protein
MTAQFDNSFFVAVATAVPVIWVATGVSTEAIRHVVELTRAAGKPRKVDRRFYKLEITDSKINMSLFRVPLLRFRGNDVRDFPFIVFLTLFLGPGVLAEIISLYSLMERNSSLRLVDFIFAVMVIVVGAIIIFVSMVAISISGDEE